MESEPNGQCFLTEQGPITIIIYESAAIRTLRTQKNETKRLQRVEVKKW